MLRRSEAATTIWGDLGRAEDGSGPLAIRRSKTDQTGEGLTLYLGRAAMRAVGFIRPIGFDARDLVLDLSPTKSTDVSDTPAGAQALVTAPPPILAALEWPMTLWHRGASRLG